AAPPGDRGPGAARGRRRRLGTRAVLSAECRDPVAAPRADRSAPGSPGAERTAIGDGATAGLLRVGGRRIEPGHLGAQTPGQRARVRQGPGLLLRLLAAAGDHASLSAGCGRETRRRAAAIR